MLPLCLAGEFGNDSECVFVEISDMSDMSAMMAWVFASRISSSYPRQHTDTTAKTNGKKKKVKFIKFIFKKSEGHYVAGNVDRFVV